MQSTTVLPPGGAVPPQNVVFVPQYVTSQQEPQIWANYAGKSSTALGATQMVIGFVCVVCNAVALSIILNIDFYEYEGLLVSFDFVGHGIWGGVFFMLTGAFGLAAGKYKTTCPIVAFMILSILSASIFATVVLILSASGVALNDGYYESVWVLDILILSMSVVEIIVAIWSSALCCAAVCCGRRQQSGMDIQQGAIMMNAGATQVLYTTGTSYPQTGQMFQQQAIATAVGQQQQFSGAPMAQVPQSTMPYPPQAAVPQPLPYTATAGGPPPYTQAQLQGAVGATGPMPPIEDEDRKNAF